MKIVFLSVLLYLLSGLQWFSDVVLPKSTRVTPVVHVSATTTESSPTVEVVAVKPKEKKVAEKTTAPPKPTPKAITLQISSTSAPPIQEVLPDPSKQADTISDLSILIEQEVLVQTNAERAKNGLVPLSSDATLATIARAHSTDMLLQDYFSHEDLNGCSSSCRADKVGYRWSMIGENIYMMSGYTLNAKEAAEMIVQGWMNSPGHRANIVRESYTHTGIGVFVREKDIYTTAIYAKPR